MFSRTYGVEIEAQRPASVTHEALAAAITAAGVPCEAQMYNHLVGSRWKIVSDRSLGEQSAEIVSPPLSGREGFQQIQIVSRVLIEEGLHVDKRCGLHVHVDVKRPAMDIDALRRLAMLYIESEEVIDLIMPPSRRGDENYYTKSIARTPMSALTRATDAGQIAAALAAGADIDKRRYVKLNFLAVAKYGTVEFRHHSGTVEAEKITQWVIACLRLVKTATEETKGATSRSLTRSVRRVRSGSKTEIIRRLLLRSVGCTHAEVLAETGWAQVSVAGVAHNIGLEVRKETAYQAIDNPPWRKRVIRYFGYVPEGPLTIERRKPVAPDKGKPKTLEEWADRLGMEGDEKEFWVKRARAFAQPAIRAAGETPIRTERVM